MTDLSKIIISTLSVNVFYDARTRCSPSWKYFGHLVTKEDNKKRILNSEHVYCLACLDDVKKHSEDVIFGSIKIKRYNKSVSTGNLTRHLRDDHNIQEEPIRRVKPKNNKSKVSSSKSDRYDKLELAKDLAAWFCKSLIPFDYFGGNGMMDFLKKYKIARGADDIPSRSIVSGSALSELYESLLKHVEETISVDAAQHFSITFDLWTDLRREIKYITFTLHYLTSDLVLKSWHLTTERMNEKITARSLNEVIQKLKKRFNLNGNEVIAVTYSGKKIHQAVAKTNMTQHLCLGHGLHKLVIVDGINSIPEIIAVVKKCKRIVKTVGYRSSEMEVEAKQVQKRQFLGRLDEVIENLEMDESDPITQDDTISLEVDIDEAEVESNSNNNKPISKTKYEIPSRWHCVLEMLEFVINICNRETMNFMLTRINQGILAISQHEWILLEELVKFLRCFREAVEILSCQETCTLNVALVFRSEIIDVLKSCQDKESKSMIDLKNNMMANIDRRFPVTKEIAAAALLDSRFMSLKEIDIFLEKNNMTRISFLSSYIKELIGAVDESGIEHNERKSNNNSLLHKLSKKHSINMNQGVQDDYIEQECWRYVTVADPSEPKDGDLLSFWNSKKNVFPNIAGLAKYLLCVPATVTPSERMFSVAGLTYTAKRSRLTPNLLNKIMFIHNNSPTL